MNKQRKPRAYKITDANYNRAMRRAKKEKTPLASLIEEVVIAYGNGDEVAIIKSKPHFPQTK